MKYTVNFKLILSVCLCAFLAASCVKEGPMGPAGADGEDGTDGLDGTDGTAGCIVCHSDNQVIFAFENQWSASQHALGTAFERNYEDCATCHTSQGFLGKLDGSYDWTADDAEIPNPNPPNCYTCHSIHETFTADDLELKVTGEIELNNTELAHDFGKGSICASCHQARPVEPYPVVGDSIQIPSPYWGPHHGTQGNLVAGVGMGLFEVGDGFTNSAHASMADACVTCHMAEPYGTQAGGHTMSMTYEYHGSDAVWAEGCLNCHTEDEAHELTEDFQAEIKGLLTQLKTELDVAGITESGGYRPVPGKYSGLLVGAYVNYYALSEDGSYGVHNPKYAKKLLENTIAALNAEE